MAAALRSGGQVVGVPTEGLRRVGRRPDVRQPVLDDRLTLASPYSPDAGFTAGNAMGRNKLIYALADVTLVVASDDGRGGTWGGAVEALRRGFGRVAAWTGPGAGPGNEPLVRKGAVPVDDVEHLFAVATTVERQAGSQGTFDLGLKDAEG
jgi:predicted Rossmann fold nucleotide-binding protein DprA/Smf involved in DNA uptake